MAILNFSDVLKNVPPDTPASMYLLHDLQTGALPVEMSCRFPRESNPHTTKPDDTVCLWQEMGIDAPRPAG